MPRSASTMRRLISSARGACTMFSRWTLPAVVGVVASVATPIAAHAAIASPFGCGTYLCLTVLTGPLSSAPIGAISAYATGWVGQFARTQNVALLPSLQALGATSYEWHVSVVGHYVEYCAGGVVCDRDAFSDVLSGGVGVPARSVNVFGAGPNALREWDVRLASPVEFSAYDADGRIVATDRFTAAVVLTPEPTTLVLAGAGLVGFGVIMRRRKNG